MIVLKIDDGTKSVFGKCCHVCENEPMPMLGDGKVAVDTVKSIIGCELFDIVDLGHGISAWLDDEGLFTKRGEYNWPATALRMAYWCQQREDILCPCQTPPLCGTVVLLGSTDEEGDQLDLNEEQVKYIKSILG